MAGASSLSDLMSTTNINDPAGVAALLEQLKASTAWQELSLSTSSGAGAGAGGSGPDVAIGALPSGEDVSGSVSGHSGSEGLVLPELSAESAAHGEIGEEMTPGLPGSSVALLLSQLKPLSVHHGAKAGFGSTAGSLTDPTPAPSSKTSTVDEVPVQVAVEDRSNMTFRDSLPMLSDLARDDTFVAAMKKMKDDQDVLERQLFADRESLYTKYHDKFKVSLNKARMIGTVASQHEVDMLTDGFKTELRKFDHERVIPAWDGLVSRQQQELERLNIPAMFLTGMQEDRERQQQIMQVLETLVGVGRKSS